MVSRRRNFVISGAAALVLLAFASPQYHANIRILAHQPGDLAPHRLRAAVDVGLVAVSVLVTWTRKLAS